MVPAQRYFALNEALTRLRGGPYTMQIKGTDELRITHDSVMLEAANASFQVHFQAGPEEFPRLYNIAMAVAAPVLAAAVNSPLMLGRRLWHETRIAVFQQSIDTRQTISEMRETEPRVSFGRRWVDDSVLEIFREDISRFKVLLGKDIDEDPFEAIAAGRAPALKALQLFNSTVYRWNRACYGIKDGIAHLRIENRVLPAGPIGARRGVECGILVRPRERTRQRSRRRQTGDRVRRRADELRRRRTARSRRTP